MYNSVINYLSTNIGNLISSGIFCILGVVLGILCTPKDPNPYRNSGISISQTQIIINQIIIQRPVSQQIGQSYPSRDTNTDSNLQGFIVCSLIVTAIYSKYHILILNIFTGLILMSLTSAITIVIVLHKNNNLDNLNRWWISLMLIIVAIDLISLLLMSRQDVTISGDLQLLFKVLYYALGFVMVIIPNIFTLLLTTHLFALNTFLVKRGKISYFFYRKTHFFTTSPRSVSIVLIVFSLLSLLLSSGTAYNFIKAQSDANTKAFFENISK